MNSITTIMRAAKMFPYPAYSTGLLHERYQMFIEQLRSVIDSQVSGSQAVMYTDYRSLNVSLYHVGKEQIPTYYVRYYVRTRKGARYCFPFAFTDIDVLRECLHFLVMKNPAFSTIREKYKEDVLPDLLSSLYTERMRKAMNPSA